jgi:3alpha(or 20beta)-hydroxysteroid dehydrogenase
VNQFGCLLGMQAVIPSMASKGGGAIVNIASTAALQGMAGLAAYVSSKFAIRGMTKVAALELGPKGIRVNSVHPGMIDTKMVHDALGGHDVDVTPVTKKLALRRVGTAEEMAQLVLFLASDRCSYCTGAEFVADGGSTATHALNMGG